MHLMLFASILVLGLLTFAGASLSRNERFSSLCSIALVVVSVAIALSEFTNSRGAVNGYLIVFGWMAAVGAIVLGAVIRGISGSVKHE